MFCHKHLLSCNNRDTNKVYNVMRFAEALKVDVKSWTNETKVKMEKEGSALMNNIKSLNASSAEGSSSKSEEIPNFGAGSEFGRKEREEARIKRYTPRSRKRQEDAPWLLKVGNGKTAKRYKGIREGGITDNSSLYVFFKANEDTFEAVPVKDWFNFNLQTKHSTLTAEEAEEVFEKREKILNFFTVMKTRKDGEEGRGSAGGTDSFDSKPKKKSRDSKGFKVTEMDDWGPDSDADDDDYSGGEGSDSEAKKKKGKGKKGKRESDVDSEAGEESDEGDFDTREMDYISSSSDDDDDEDLNERLNRELKGVEDEDALRGLVISDSEEDEDAEKDKDVQKEDDVNDSNSRGPDDPGLDKKKKVNKDGEISDESVSGSDDSDLDDEEVEKSKSWLFIQGKKEPPATTIVNKNGRISESAPNSRSGTPSREVKVKMPVDESSSPLPAASGSSSSMNVDSKAGIKRKLDSTASTSTSSSHSTGTSSKKQKTNDDEVISEESIRRYLMRKPMTIKDLIRKFKKKHHQNLTSHELVTKIGTLLKKINPEKVKVKDEMYLSLK